MAGLKLDGTGNVKMATLEEASLMLQRLHATVEQWGLALKRNQNTSMFAMNVKRNLPALAGKLKGQFGMISDQVTAMMLIVSRGGAEAPKLRAMREGVALVKQALEIAITQTKDKHALHDEKKGAPPVAGH